MAIITGEFNPTGATNGTAIQTTDAGDLTAWDTIVRNGGGTINYDNTQTLFGKSLSAKFVSVAAADVLEWVASYNGVTTDFGRLYVQFSSLPSAAMLVVTGGNPRIQINTNGTVSIKNSATTISTSTTVLSINTWYRIEWTWVYASSATGSIACSIYTNPNSTTAAETISGSSINFGASSGTSLLLGCNSNATVTMWLASVVATAPSAVGPYPVNTTPATVSGSAPVGSTLTANAGTWNGTFTLGYQWQRDGVNIGGATGSTYVTQAADVGHAVGVVETSTGQIATNESASQASSNTVTVTGGGGSSDPQTKLGVESGLAIRL